MKNSSQFSQAILQQLSQQILIWGKEIGFNHVGITNPDLSDYETGYFKWIEQGFHGDMDYMAKHGTKRTRPQELEPETLSIISCRINYFDTNSSHPIEQLQTPSQAYISRYALNKDYHKFIRKSLEKIAEKINQYLQLELGDEPLNLKYRCFSDSAPVLERAIAEKAGLGFTGKNSLIIHPDAGSWFFLGEIYINLSLTENPKQLSSGCGKCTACIDECPTKAILEDGVVDAKRCISYLTIEYSGSIDEELRPLMGNRIYGCDDCQLVCPWNHFTQDTASDHFKANKLQLDNISLPTLANWTETEFLTNLQGSPIRRIGFEKWQRNICIALGNACLSSDLLARQQCLEALQNIQTESEMVLEHQQWAIKQFSIAHDNPSKPISVYKKMGKPAFTNKYYVRNITGSKLNKSK